MISHNEHKEHREKSAGLIFEFSVFFVAISSIKEYAP